MIRTFRVFLEMFEPGERRKFAILMALIAFTAMFEVVSIASVLPFLQVLSTPEIVETSNLMARAYALSGAETTLGFARLLGFASIALILTGMGMRIAALYGLTRFGLRRSYTMSTRLLSGYLSQPYPWFLSHNSATLSKTILAEVDGVVSNSLLPTLRLIQAGVTVTLTIGLLVVVQPFVAGGAIVVIGGCYFLVYLFLRGRLRRSGERRLLANRRRYRSVYEAMGGVKEIKFMGLEQGASQRYAEAASIIAREGIFAAVAGQVPRFLLEGVAFSGLIVAVMLMIAMGDGSIVDLVPVFGLLAVAMARLFPALQMLYQQIAQIRSNEAILTLVHEQLTAHGKAQFAEATRAHTRPTALKPLHSIGLDKVSYTYPGGEAQSVSDLSMDIPVGSRIGIVGGTGAGKTTLIDVLLGLLHPDEGAIMVDGAPVAPEDVARWQGAMGYVPQDIALWDLSVRQNIAFGIAPDQIDQARVEAAAKRAKLHDFVTEKLPEGYDTVVGDRGVRLSGGQRQRIGIARSLYNEPEVLIFDEATSALDNLTERSVMAAIEELSGKMTVIMVAHRLSTVQSCDCIFLLENGRIAASGTYDQLVTENETFRNMARPA